MSKQHETKIENSQLNAVQSGTANVNVNARGSSIRELTPEEKRKKTLLDEKRKKLFKFVTIKKGESIVFITSYSKCDLKEVLKFGSQTEMETKLVCKVIVPDIDPENEKELKFTPRQGDELVKLLELGYTRIVCTRNDKDGKDTRYEFGGLE